MVHPLFYVGLSMTIVTLLGAPYLRAKSGRERTRQLASEYLVAGFGIYSVHHVLFEGFFGNGIFPNAPEKVVGLMVFPGIAFMILAGITFVSVSKTSSGPDVTRET